MTTAARRAWLAFALFSFISLFTITPSHAALPSPEPGTKTVTITRGGQSFERTVLDPVVIDGRAVRRGAVIVRFKNGVPAAAKGDAHRAAAAEQVHALKLANTDRVDVRPGSEQHALDVYRGRPEVEYAQLDTIMKADYTPNDTRFSELWGMTKIHAPGAWDVTHSTSAVKIAILDCGIYSSSSTYLGPDGYGHVDVRSKVVAESNFSAAADTDDWCNHGTHVAGTAAAVTNNAIGVAGVGHDAVLMNGKVLGDDGSGSESSVINGLVWAADNNAKVINLSLGAQVPCSTALQDGVTYAWNHGAVVVVAAGNSNSSTPSNLTLCANTLSVAATDSTDARAAFSNYGTAVDVAAPGVGILSSNDTGGYVSYDGTSMASPHVAGLAALVWTAGPTTNAAVVSRITSTASAIAGTGVYWAHGRVDAAAAVALPPPPPPAINWAANNLVDFDGDHKTDMGALYRGLSPANSLWFSLASGGGSAFQIYFGATSDIPVPGDYNGDGKTDAVIFRPSTGLWYGPQTGAAVIVIQLMLGQAGDVPIPGDYDGDGKTDPAIYRPSTGLFFAVLSGGGVKSTTFGAPTDVPVPRDYDGDGKTDFAIYRADATPDHRGLWYSPLSGGGLYQIYFGAPGDIPVPGDYNGDKKAEAVIFREATGLWYGPFNGAPGLFQLLLGGPGVTPIPGYYDNNLTEDPAIFQKAAGLWFALNSGGGITRIDGLGLATDVAIQKRPALAGGL